MYNMIYLNNTHPNSSDSNPGTIDMPMKTLSRALEVSEDNTKIKIVEGIYSERVVITKDDIVLSSENETKFIRPSIVLIDPTKWEKVENRDNVYEQPIPECLKIYLKIENDRCILEEGILDLYAQGICVEYIAVTGKKKHVNFGNGVVTFHDIIDGEISETDRNRWTITSNGFLQINLANPLSCNCKIEIKDGNHTSLKIEGNRCEIYGIAIEGGNCAIEITGKENIVSDCLIEGCYFGARVLGTGSINNIIRRTTFLLCKQGIYIDQSSGYSIFEENFIIGAGKPFLTERSPQNDLHQPWGPGCSLRYSNTHFNVFRYNIIADGTWAGWWPDVNCFGNYFYGNCISNLSDRGIYNEYPVNDSKIYYNSITNCNSGITQRFSWRTTTMYNYLEDNRQNGLALWGPHVDNPYKFDCIIARNEVKNNQIGIEYLDNDSLYSNLPVANQDGCLASPLAQRRIESNLIYENIYKSKSNQILARFNGKNIFSIDELNKITNQDIGSELNNDESIEKFGLKMFSVKIPFTQNENKSVKIVGNPIENYVHSDLLPVQAEDSLYFWQQGNQDEIPGNKTCWESAFGYDYEWPHFNHPVARLVRSEIISDEKETVSNCDYKYETFIELISWRPDRIPTTGSGFWSHSLPCVSKSKISIIFSVRSIGCEGNADVPFTSTIKFYSVTGKLVQSINLTNNPILPTYCKTWMKIKNNIIVPENSCRFYLFIGMLPCDEGQKLQIKNIEIQTKPDMLSFETDEEHKKHKIYQEYSNRVDLNNFYNHELNEDTGGPDNPEQLDEYTRFHCDLPIINTKYLEEKTVDFNGLKVVPKAAVVLGCSRRKPVVLPFDVFDIPINTRIKGFIFVHTGKHLSLAQENWRYIVKCNDSIQKEIVPVIDKSEMHYKQQYFIMENNLEFAEKIGEQDGLEFFYWKNSNPEEIVETFDFRSMDAGQSILIDVFYC